VPGVAEFDDSAEEVYTLGIAVEGGKFYGGGEAAFGYCLWLGELA
jgi:hypothetical protein